MKGMEKIMRLIKLIGSLVVVVLALLGTTLLAQAAGLRQNAQNGAALFNAKCIGCHTIGGGVRVGPDLKDITQAVDGAWLKQFIRTPDQVLASGDPTAAALLAQFKVKMPNLNLSAAEVDDLIAYLGSPEASTSQANDPAQQVMAMTGSVERGRLLFSGGTGMQNGGTPCMACHSVSGVSWLGGGALGPDLTQVYSRLGRTGLASALGSLPFPTMQGVFAGKPLALAEQADLLAFFEKSSQAAPPLPLLNLGFSLGLGAVITAGLFGLLLLFWPRQRMSIAQRLRKNGSL